ncbi:hypothetical protein BDP81DRAFT_404510 [Colletotrichum phormii]|uniref:Uncharacterized protein n=1 Tax=Colletotrichum phormii TaxID=359342 RepID=A0AAI9ZXU3_9PEZI|nr:uncharacterized protein BDP81DRAFT_404510 [Colletotrichum phormii]KAK1639861.1 hypothetical protein BDP81DRAFT_404510 [Colletotrichum phormii]
MRSPYPELVGKEECTRASKLDQDKPTPHFDARMKTALSGGGMLAIGLYGRPVNGISTWKPTERLFRYLDMLVSPTLSVLSVFLVVGVAKNQVAMNPHNNVVFDAKRLIGCKFQDSEVH